MIVKPTTDKFVFKRPNKDYKTRLDPVSDYLSQQTKLAMKLHPGISMADMSEIVREEVHKCKITNPIVKHTERQHNEDMAVVRTPLRKYITDSLEQGDIIVPSFTAYINPEKRLSLQSDYQKVNVALRSADKKKAINFKTIGDMFWAKHFGTLQGIRKIFNNALSGSSGAQSTILYNPSAHYSLTSMTRGVASIGNSISESMVAGNKHFKDSESVMNYISAILDNVSMRQVKLVLNKFNLIEPTVEQTMSHILYSSRNYWHSVRLEGSIRRVIDSLTGPERAAVTYVNDLYAVNMYNPKMIHGMLTEMSSKGTYVSPDPMVDLPLIADGIMNQVHLLYYTELIGINSDYNELAKSNPALLARLVGTGVHINSIYYKYKVMLRVLFASNVLPINIVNIRDMLRDAIVLSDTDSTCASYDEWSDGYYGKIVTGPDALRISGTVMTIVTQIMDHHIKSFSKNMNIPGSKVDLLKMKNEYYWDVFVRTHISKHYYARVMVVEGKVFKDPGLELKGVNLIASTSPKEITQLAKSMELDIMDTVGKGNKIDIYEYISKVVRMETSIRNTILAGDVSIYKTHKIKNKDGYKLPPMQTVYQHHLLWDEVFSSTYGRTGDPEYTTVKVPMILKNRITINEFLGNIDDKVIRESFRGFLDKHGKSKLETMYIPLMLVGDRTMLKELIPYIDTYRVISDICKPLYIVMETIGFFRHKDVLMVDMDYAV